MARNSIYWSRRYLHEGEGDARGEGLEGEGDARVRDRREGGSKIISQFSVLSICKNTMAARLYLPMSGYHKPLYEGMCTTC